MDGEIAVVGNRGEVELRAQEPHQGETGKEAATGVHWTGCVGEGEWGAVREWSGESALQPRCGPGRV